MRHAKSSWDNPLQTDFERPLNARGLRDAPKMGELMRAKNLHIDLIVSSPAARAAATAETIKNSIELDRKIQLEPRIYEARASDLLEVVNGFSNDCDCVLIVGHNPGFEDLVRHLTGQTREMPTAAVARIELDIQSWRDAKQNAGRLINLFKPKEAAD